MKLTPTIAIFLLVFGPLLGALVSMGIGRALRRRRLRLRFRQGRGGERRARAYLLQHGFEILAAEPVAEGRVWVDRRQVTYAARADFLVAKRGRIGLVEVKTGEAADPTGRNTRRQLLEYGQLYDVDELYLFDADQNRLHRLRFPNRSPRHRLPAVALAWLVGLLMGVGLSLLLLDRGIGLGG